MAEGTGGHPGGGGRSDAKPLDSAVSSCEVKNIQQFCPSWDLNHTTTLTCDSVVGDFAVPLAALPAVFPQSFMRGAGQEVHANVDVVSCG